MVRAGIVDAEIAVRLGLSTAEVKQRIEQMARRHGVGGREGLKRVEARPASAEPADAPTLKLPVRAVAAVAAALAIGLGVGMLVGRENSEGGTEISVGATPTARAVQGIGLTEVPPPKETRLPETVYEIVVVGGRRMINTGQFFRSPYGPSTSWMTSVVTREALTFVALNGHGLADPGGHIKWESNSASTVYTASLAGRRVDLYFAPGNESTRILKAGAVMTVYSVEVGEPPVIAAWAAEQFGTARLAVSFNAAGELLVALEPLASSLAVEHSTGEALDLSKTQRVGVAAVEGSFAASMHCNERAACVTSFNVSNPGLLGPASGTLICPDPDSPPLDYDSQPGENQTLTLDVGDFRLHYYRLVQPINDINPGDILCGNTAVTTGDVMSLSGGPYVVSASDAAGNPLDLVISGDGVMHVGDIEPGIGCPCRVERGP